jgi:hypothetical protein
MPRQYGYAAIHAYQYYGMPEFLSMAEAIWNFGYTYTLTPEEVAAGSTPVLPNVTLCNTAPGM